jgi:hypothetical protein
VCATLPASPPAVFFRVGIRLTGCHTRIQRGAVIVCCTSPPYPLLGTLSSPLRQSSYPGADYGSRVSHRRFLSIATTQYSTSAIHPV